MSNICPICLKDDQVQKVSLFFSNNSGEHELNENCLLEKIMPPLLPKNPRSPGALIVFLGAVGGLIGSFGSLLLFGLLVGESAGFISCPVGGLIGITAGVIYANTLHTEKMNKYKKQLETSQIWENLYYCVRDDILFNPQTSENSDSLYRLFQLKFSEENLSKLTYRQRFAITEYGYLLSPENAEVVGKMLGNFQEKDVLPFCQANGKKVSGFGK